MKQNLLLLLHAAVLIVALLIYFKGCGPGESLQVTSSTDTIYVIDTNTYSIPAPEHHYHFTERILEVPVAVDTAAVIRDYYTQNKYLDTFSDENIRATYKGMVWKNSFFNPEFDYQILRPAQVITNTEIITAEIRNKVYIGGFGMYSKAGGSIHIGGVISLQNKREQILTAGFGYPEIYFAGFQAKLSFKKRE